MELRVKKLRQYAILTFHTHLVEGIDLSSLPTLDGTFKNLVNEGVKKFIFNFNHNYVNSMILGSIIECHKKVKTFDGRLLICNLNNTQSEILVATKLASILEIFPNEEIAVKEFFKTA